MGHGTQEYVDRGAGWIEINNGEDNRYGGCKPQSRFQVRDKFGGRRNTMKTIKALSNKNPMYVCNVCGKLTRLGNEDGGDAQFRGECVTCWEMGELEWEHELWEGGEVEHKAQEDCPICQKASK